MRFPDRIQRGVQEARATLAFSRRTEWGQAGTLPDLCELNARWLTGDLQELHPNNHCRPDPETTPIIAPLVDLNRGGFLTDGSQPGTPGPPEPGVGQRAAVEGYIADPAVLAAVRQAADEHDLILIEGDASRWRTDYSQVGDHTDGWGAVRSRRDLTLSCEGLTGEATRAIQDARQVTVIDPQVDRNDVLWPALQRAITEPEADSAAPPIHETDWKEPIMSDQTANEVPRVLGYADGDRVVDGRDGSTGTVRIIEYLPEEAAEAGVDRVAEVRWDHSFVATEVDVAGDHICPLEAEQDEVDR